MLSRPNKRSCKALGEPMSLIYASENEIRMLSQKDNTLTVVYSEETPRITGLDISVATGYIYFSIKDSGTIHKLHATNKTKFYIPSVGQPEKITLDWISNNVYFVNGNGKTKSIDVCHFDSGKCARIKEFGIGDHITAISVDPINKYLFYATVQWWVFNSPHYTLYRINLDGTKSNELIKVSKGFVTGMTYDSNKKLLYLVEHHDGQILSLNYDGTDLMPIIYNITSPRGLNLFEDQLFFLTSLQQMGKCTLYGENRYCDTFKLHSYMSYLFVISQESRQPAGNNICAKHNCSHLCVPSDVEIRCLCENGELIEEHKQCPEDTV